MSSEYCYFSNHCTRLLSYVVLQCNSRSYLGTFRSAKYEQVVLSSSLPRSIPGLRLRTQTMLIGLSGKGSVDKIVIRVKLLYMLIYKTPSGYAR